MKRIFVLAVITISICSCSNKVTSVNEGTVVSANQDTAWIFKPSFATPQTGQSFPITAEYAVKYSPNKIDVYLPYRGQAYAGADLINGENPLRFTSTDFTEKRTQLKKGRTELLISFNKDKNVEYMRFTFYPDGNAYLQVSMISRTAINFTGSKSTG